MSALQASLAHIPLAKATFYLINVGFVSLALRFGVSAASQQEALESLSTKIGLVMLVLGAMHFLNLRVFTACRRRALDLRTASGLPLPPPLPHNKMTAV